ncbi:MAG TPA: lytic transglycosylase domain-containing protein [Chloroflexota bacterium]|nr:lytic transglycosylase domain-containing protein [Chloroflexota bacterium]
MAFGGWRSVSVAALLALPVWAALDGTHRTAYLPAVDDAAFVGVLTELAGELAGEAHVAPADQVMAAPPVAPAPFPPLVARWQALVEGELQVMRATRGLSEAITPELVLAVIAAESGGDPDARSQAHAAGLMQVLPTTLAALLAERPTPSPFDPTANVRAGILYLDEALRSHQGDVSWALAAYNAGIPSTLRARSNGAPPFSESRAFVTRVMSALPSSG